MARVETSPLTQELIKHRLAWLRKEWEAVPGYAQQWLAWDEETKLDFVLEAGIREDYLAGARDWARRGILKPAQLAELREIEAIASANRPLLEPLLAED